MTTFLMALITESGDFFMDNTGEREERIKLYARALGRSEEDIEAQLTRVDKRRAMRVGEPPDILQIASEIAEEYGMTTIDLLRRTLQISQKFPIRT